MTDHFVIDTRPKLRQKLAMVTFRLPNFNFYFIFNIVGFRVLPNLAFVPGVLATYGFCFVVRFMICKMMYTIYT